MSVHLHIHGVSDIAIEDAATRHELVASRLLVISTARGERFELVLFSEDPRALVIHPGGDKPAAPEPRL